jgi:integrase
VAAWGSRHVSEVRRADVAELLDAIAQRSPAVARATYAELRPLFDWCVEKDLIAGSPCVSLTAPPRPKARDRVLAEPELRLIWRAADSLGFPFGHVLKLLMLTGQRRAEVAGMTWDELDLEGARWRIPGERAKNGQAHEIDLPPEALAILKDVPNTGPHLFPARGGGAVRGFSATKRSLDAEIEELRRQDASEAGAPAPKKPLAPWRIHDLRRTAATGMAALGFAPHVVERVLNHVSGTQSGLVGVYQRHDYRQERKAAITAWCAQVAAVVKGEALPSNVRRLRA